MELYVFLLVLGRQLISCALQPIQSLVLQEHVVSIIYHFFSFSFFSFLINSFPLPFLEILSRKNSTIAINLGQKQKIADFGHHQYSSSFPNNKGSSVVPTNLSGGFLLSISLAASHYLGKDIYCTGKKINKQYNR